MIDQPRDDLAILFRSNILELELHLYLIIRLINKGDVILSLEDTKSNQMALLQRL